MLSYRNMVYGKEYNIKLKNKVIHVGKFEYAKFIPKLTDISPFHFDVAFIINNRLVVFKDTEIEDINEVNI